MPLLVPATATTVTITGPDKSVTHLTVPEAHEALVFDGADQVGLYNAEAGNWKQTFAVSMLSKSESDLQPRDALKMGDKSSFVAQNRAKANRELWGYLITAALMVLIVEWWVYHRGV